MKFQQSGSVWRRTGIGALVRDQFVFYSQVFRATAQVGAFSPTSTLVARTVTAPVAIRNGAAMRILEVGGGTGAVTRAILDHLRPDDRLDIYEINPTFACHLRNKFGRLPAVRVFEADFETIPEDARYDVIVSTLPLMNLPSSKVARIFMLFERSLAPGGMLSYWDYWGKEFRCFIQWGRERHRMLEVLRIEREFHDRYFAEKRVIPWNIPPVRVHRVRKKEAISVALPAEGAVIREGRLTH